MLSVLDPGPRKRHGPPGVLRATIDSPGGLGQVRPSMAPARTHSSQPADRGDRARRAAAPAASSPEQDAVPRALRNAVLALVLVAAALIRWRLAGAPLERDEGEYAYAGQLVLQGVAPYQLVYNMKFPGTYYAYGAILALFGQSAAAIRIGLLLVNAATTLLLFHLARRTLGERAALVTAAAFAVLSLDRWIMGVFAHATHFVILPVVAGLLLLERARDSRRTGLLAAAGALLGTAVLMKQHAVVFVPFALALALWRDLRLDRVAPGVALRHAGALAAGAAAPFAILCAVLAAQGAIGRFWFWAIQYARAYVSEVPWTGALPALMAGLRSITVATWALWLLAALGLVGLWLAPWRRETRTFVTGFLLVSFLATCPGFYFRQHYFIVTLPAVAILAGVAVVSLERLLARRLPPAAAAAVAIGTFLAAVLADVVPERGYLLSMSAAELTRTRYGRNPFVEAPEIGRYLREHTSAADRIAVIGSEPEIYFYARRRSATGYVYMYPLMEPQALAPRMQDEMMREIEAAHPGFVVFVATRASWAPRPDSDRRILAWADRYLRGCYDVVGVAERLPEGESVFRWDAEAAGYRPRTEDVVYTLRRRSDAPCSAEAPAPAPR